MFPGFQFHLNRKLLLIHLINIHDLVSLLTCNSIYSGEPVFPVIAMPRLAMRCFIDGEACYLLRYGVKMMMSSFQRGGPLFYRVAITFYGGDSVF